MVVATWGRVQEAYWRVDMAGQDGVDVLGEGVGLGEGEEKDDHTNETPQLV